MASVKGPLYLSPNNLPDEQVAKAVAFLQAAGYTVLRKPPVEIGAFQDVTLHEFHEVPQVELARRTIHALGVRLGHEALLHANITAVPNKRFPQTEYRARLLVVPVGEVGPAGLNIRNPSL